MYFWIIISALSVLIDQLSKILVSLNFTQREHLVFIPGIIDLVYVQNTGAAFSIFENYTWILGVVSLLFSVGIVYYMIKTKPKDKLTIISAGLLLGGAVGNGIDRFVRGYVVDFLELAFINFPVFNIADIAITAGAALLIVAALLPEKKTDVKEEE